MQYSYAQLSAEEPHSATSAPPPPAVDDSLSLPASGGTAVDDSLPLPASGGTLLSRAPGSEEHADEDCRVVIDKVKKLDGIRATEKYLRDIASMRIDDLPEFQSTGVKRGVKLDVVLGSRLRCRIHCLAMILGLSTWTDRGDDHIIVFYTDGKPPKPPAPTWFEAEIFAALSKERFVYIPIYILLSVTPLITCSGSLLQ
eukprot:COSAG02_NODE_7044_length_3213_cov_1.195890_3_plen_199_part_00